VGVAGPPRGGGAGRGRGARGGGGGRERRRRGRARVGPAVDGGAHERGGAARPGLGRLMPPPRAVILRRLLLAAIAVAAIGALLGGLARLGWDVPGGPARGVDHGPLPRLRLFP